MAEFVPVCRLDEIPVGEVAGGRVGSSPECIVVRLCHDKSSLIVPSLCWSGNRTVQNDLCEVSMTVLASPRR